MREVSWRLNKIATYWPPTLLAIAAFLSRSVGLLNQGPGALPQSGTGSHCSIFSLTAWLPRYIIVLRPPASCGITIRTQFNPSTDKVIPWYLRSNASVIYTSAFLLWQFGWVGGQFVTLSLSLSFLHSISTNFTSQWKIYMLGTESRNNQQPTFNTRNL